MSQSLPCIVCNAPLDNCTDDPGNQPSGGTAFYTYGHYGSTVFDPMDGTALELNLCDPCLKGAGKRGQVLFNRRSRRVLLKAVDGMIDVGRQWVHRPMVPWDPDADRYDDPNYDSELHVTLEEVGTDSISDVEWSPIWAVIVEAEKARRGEA